MVAGTIIAQIILWAFGRPFSEAVALNIVFFVASYARTYAIRRLFARLRK